jgi:hypothetical protein
MKLSIGVLLVGSLDWESKDYGDVFHRRITANDCQRIARRTKWRKERLMSDAASEFYVSAPIRYGRKSRTRGNSFTTVFSPELASRLGRAKAVRCKRDVTSIDDLTSEAMELWVAESSETHRGKLSANWGCVTLLVPEDFLNGSDRDERTALLANWTNRVTLDTDYGRASFSTKDREAARGNVIDGGRLKISWPALDDGKPLPLNLLLATVTDPEIGQTVTKDYPSPQNIAKAWNDAPEYAYYFRYNRLAGIQTAEDSEIEKFLKK